ncbi:MAG: synthase [Schlesneria sp.]|nr:synthase [Schlesneria sp.]
MQSMIPTPKLILLGEYDPTRSLHAATSAAIEHSCSLKSIAIDYRWVSTVDIESTDLRNIDGLWVAPGSPYKNLEATLQAIRIAREQGIPCLGTCGGFQHMILEYARNVLGFDDAHHAEYDPYASRLFLTRLACSLVGREMQLKFTPDSQVAQCYGAITAHEQYYCNFGVNPESVDLLRQGPLRISGHDAEGEVRVIELPGHPFFVGTLFVPQTQSTIEQPHPLVSGFVTAVAEHCQ